MADLAWPEAVIRLLAAALFGAALGLERETDGQDAGFRTHLLVSTGAALFGLISVAGFGDATGGGIAPNVTVDASRVAAYVPAGIGFIGGGAIIKYAGSVKGITTAASLWAAAAIGLGTGLGFWVPVLTTTVVTLVALLGLKPVSRWIQRRGPGGDDTLMVVLTDDAAISELIGLLEAEVDEFRRIEVGTGAKSGTTDLRVRFWTPSDTRSAAATMDRIGRMPGVVAVRLGS